MTDFQRRVYEMVENIPRGLVASYGGIAARIGQPRAARGVGTALSHLDGDTRVPWWRVVNHQGRISTSRITHTAQIQRALLESEGVEFDSSGRVSWDRFGWREPRECAAPETPAAT